jgi:RNA polymerase sigma-70 factor, ECF subfamily
MAIDEAPMAPELARLPVGDSAVEEGATIERLIAEGKHREALGLCARRFAMPLGRLCMAFTGSQAESEELVQETLLAAFDAFPQYRAEGSVRAWLFGIARRICGRHTEIKARRQERLRLVHDTGRARDAADIALERERAVRARAALAKLKPSEREAIVLRFEGELSFRDLATACGVDEAAARKRVSRALARLRADLGEE